MTVCPQCGGVMGRGITRCPWCVTPATTPASRPRRAWAPVLAAVLMVLLAGGLTALALMTPHDHAATREALVRADLRLLREAIAEFRADTGAFPASLTDLTISLPNGQAAPTTGIDAAGHAVAIPAGAYHGPYLPGGPATIGATGIPRNPRAAATDDITHHWQYRNGLIEPAGPTDR